MGTQIVLFHNTYVNKRIHLIAPVGKVIRDNRVQMPVESMDKLEGYLDGMATETDVPREQHYKYLGK